MAQSVYDCTGNQKKTNGCVTQKLIMEFYS